MSKTIRVGLIGAGFIGRSHATAYVNQCQFGSDIKVELKVVADPFEASAKALAESHGLSVIPAIGTRLSRLMM